jgi:hypothetical protein
MNDTADGRRERIRRCASEVFPRCVVVFDEERGHWVRFRIETRDGTMLTNASPDFEPSEIDDWPDEKLKTVLLSLCGR